MENKIVLENIDNGSTKRAKKFGWIEWNEDSTFKSIHDKPAIGRSLILDPHLMMYTWLTSITKEVISESETEIEFRTKNTHYKLLISC